jgi:hypothetical protein
VGAKPLEKLWEFANRKGRLREFSVTRFILYFEN